MDIIDGLEAPKRCYDRPFRLIVTDVFKHPQMGLSVAGKVSYSDTFNWSLITLNWDFASGT